MNIEIRTERTHLFAPNVGVAIKVEIIGNPSDSQLKAAIKTAVQANAAICQKIIISQDGKAYYESTKPYFNIEITNKNWIDIVSAIPKNPFHIFEGEMVRFYIIKHNDMMELLVVGHHLAGDGLSFTYLIEDILQALSGFPLLNKPLNTVCVDDFPAKSKMCWYKKAYLQNLNKKWLKCKTVFKEEDYTKLTQKYAQGYNGAVFEKRLNSDELRNIIAFGKKEGVTVNSILATAFFRAYGKKALTGMPISIRAAKNKGMGNWASGLSIIYQYDNKTDFSSNVKEVHKQIYAFINNISRKYFALRFVDMMDGSLLDSVCMEKYLGFSNPITHKMSELMNYDENPRDLGITNLTKVTIPAMYGDFSIKKMSFAAPVVPYGVRIIAIATFEDEMCITMNTIAPDKNKEQQLFNQAIDFLCRL